MEPDFTIEQFKEWVDETFPDNRERAIAEYNFRDGLAKLADFVFQTNSSAFIEQTIEQIVTIKQSILNTQEAVEELKSDTIESISTIDGKIARAEAAATRAELGLVYKGAYNVSTNTIPLTAIPNAAWPDGSYVDITPNSGPLPFAGTNFLSGQQVNSGDRLKKVGTQWSWIKASDLALQQVTELNKLLSGPELEGLAFVWKDFKNKLAAYIDGSGAFKAYKWVPESIPSSALVKFNGTDKLNLKSVNYGLLGDDVTPGLAKTIDFEGLRFVFNDAANKFALTISDDGTTTLAKLKVLNWLVNSIPSSALKSFNATEKLNSKSVSFDLLGDDVRGLMTSYKDIPGYAFVFNDSNGKFALAISEDGTVTIPKLNGNTSSASTKRYLGEKFLAIGDSVTAAQKYQTWIAQLTGATVTTHAKGGIGLVTMVDGDGATTDPLPALTAAQLQDKKIVTIFGSLNDRARLIGTRADMYPAQQTIYARLNYVINKVYTLAASVNRKDLRIVLITPHKVGKYNYIDADGGQEYPAGSGQTLETIANTIIDLGGFYGLPVIDLYHNSGINNYNWEVLTANTVPNSGPYPGNADNVHPNDAGYKQIGTYIASQLNIL